MNSEQKMAHQRMLANLTVRTHLRMNVGEGTNNMARPSSVSSEAGRKGRLKAGLVVPCFRTVGQKKRGI